MKRSNTFSWLDATKFVLSKSEEAMCQTQILQKISDLGLKDTRVPNSGEMVMRALLANSTGKNPIICKVEDKKFVINNNYKSAIFNHENFTVTRRQLPQRKKTKTMSDDFVDSDSVFEAKDDKISYSPYSPYSFHHARKNKRMRTRPAVSVPRVSVKPAILLKESVNMTVQPSENNRTAVQEMLNGNSDIMKYDGITRKCLNMEEFLKLSKCQQSYLAALLPVSDVRKDRSNIKLAPSALSNPFFVSFFREWHDKLCKGELSVDFKAKIKAETDRQTAKDPWKESFFEDVWGFSRAEEVTKSKKSPRQRQDSFEDNIKHALAAIPSSFLISPTPDPIQDTLTPPTSDSSEHDRSSHILGCNGTHDLSHDTLSTDTEKEQQILTPDHETEHVMEPEQETDQIITPHQETSLTSDHANAVQSLTTHEDYELGDDCKPESELTSLSSLVLPDTVSLPESASKVSMDVGVVAEDAVYGTACSIPVSVESEQIIIKPSSSNRRYIETVNDGATDAIPTNKWKSNLTLITTENIINDLVKIHSVSTEKDTFEEINAEPSRNESIIYSQQAKVGSSLIKPIENMSTNGAHKSDEPISIDQLHEELELSSAPTSPSPDHRHGSTVVSPDISPNQSFRSPKSPKTAVGKMKITSMDSVHYIHTNDPISISTENLIKPDLKNKNTCLLDGLTSPEISKKRADWTKELNKTEVDPSNVMGDLDLDLVLHPSDSIMPVYDVKQISSLGDLDDPELTFDFINDSACDVTLHKAEEPLTSSKSTEEVAPIKTVTKLAVSDDISLNIMNEIKDNLSLSMLNHRAKNQEKILDERLKKPEVARNYSSSMLDSLKSYNSPETSSASSTSSPKLEQRERLTLKILKKDLLLSAEEDPPPKKHKSKKQKSHLYPDNRIPTSDLKRHDSASVNHIPSGSNISSVAHVTSSGLVSSAGSMQSADSRSSSTHVLCNGHTSAVYVSSGGHIKPSGPVKIAGPVNLAGQASPYLQIAPFKPDSVQYNMYSDEESESELKRISLQQQLLAEKGIKSSCVPVEHTQNLVKNMREKQAHQGALPNLTTVPSDESMIVLDSGSQRQQKTASIAKDAKYSKAPTSGPSSASAHGGEHSDNIRSALKAKISQRRYSDLPSSAVPYPTQSSGNHCCYVVKGCPGECVCSTAPMLFCTKCYHLSHSSCSNVLCSNCGALFKFN